MSEDAAETLLRNAGALLKQVGIESGYREARTLLFTAVGTLPYKSLPLFARILETEQIERFNALIARRVAHEPLQHILGHTGFFTVDLKTDPRALIPRSDSEEVVMFALERVGFNQSSVLSIADLGTGCGALLAALLEQLPNSRGTAIERSADALALATENFEALDQSSRVECFLGSWTNWTGWATTDLIISNPPYIVSDVIPTLAPEVRDHDPMDALDGGVDGLDAYREIITLARGMKPGAHLVLEIGYDQKATVTALLETAGFTDIAHRKDLGDNDRAIAATAP